MNPEAFMQLAIEEARKGKTPFGAVIAKDGKVIERSSNTVKTDNDPTCHAEINVIRRLTQRVGRSAPSDQYTLYSTCEPCAMCAATCFWAGIHNIVYGVSADEFSDGNPNMITIGCEEILRHSPGDFSLQKGLLREKCKQLHEEFPL